MAFVIVKNTIQAAGSYIVIFNDGEIDVPAKVKKMEKSWGIQAKHVYDKILKGFSAKIPASLLHHILNDNDVLYLEKDNICNIQMKDKRDITPNLASIELLWNQVMTNTIPLITDNYSFVHCYIVDTGIRKDHQEFTQDQVILNYNAINGTINANDDNGHGTAVAAVVGGNTVGIAPKIILHAIKVLNSQGSGYMSDIIKGLEFIYATRNKIFPTIINLSLGGSKSTSLNNVIQKCIDDKIIVVVASGNSGADACNYSPASASNALTISAHDNVKTRPSWSNYGKCVDFFAPGVSLKSAWNTSTTSYTMVSGTSFSSPVTAGIVARFLKEVPESTPAAVAIYLKNVSLENEIINAGTSSPNLRAYWDPANIISPIICTSNNINDNINDNTYDNIDDAIHYATYDDINDNIDK